MDLTILSLLLVASFGITIYLISKRLTRKNNNYKLGYPEIELKLDSIYSVTPESKPMENNTVILKETVKEGKTPAPKKRKYSNKKTSPSSSIVLDELPKAKKPSSKKPYNKKKKDVKKDKGNDLLLS
jgi:hypothetical protein